jgi:hypothetical protein
LATIPSKPVFTGGGGLTAEGLNQQSSYTEFLYNIPRAQVGRDNALTIVSGTAVAMDAVYYDTDNMVDLTAHNTRITIQTAGFYDISANATWQGAGTWAASWYMTMRVNLTNVDGTNTVTEQKNPIPSGSISFIGSVNTTKYCEVGDYLELVPAWSGTITSPQTGVSIGRTNLMVKFAML